MICRRNLFRPFTGYQYQLFVARTRILSFLFYWFSTNPPLWEWRANFHITFQKSVSFSDLTLGLNVQMGKAFGIEAKTVKWSEWNLFCSEHNDGTQFKSVSYANLSVWEMEVFSFRIYTSRWDCLRKPKLTAKNLEPCQTYHRLEALGPSRPLLLLLAGGPSTGKHHNTGQHHNTG